jgi:Tfp pilus assembly pilus retraction ATPase PilT
VYSRDFVTQAGHIVTGFAVPVDQLARGALDRIIDGFESSERTLVRARMLYAMLFA